MKNLKRHLASMASMVGGGSFVLGLVFLMNQYTTPPPAEAKKVAADFKVEKKKPPKPQQKRQQRARKSVKTPATPHAPMPNLSSALSGVSFDLPGFETADFGKIGEKLLGDTSKATAMTADVVDDPPKPRSRTQPEYPDKARQRGITGYVTLKLKVSAHGTVESVRIVEARPRGIFEESAVASIKQWHFDPGMYQGTPVETWVNQTLRYELN